MESPKAHTARSIASSREANGGYNHSLERIVKPDDGASGVNVPFAVSDEPAEDTDLVTWDGPHDPTNPKNWPKKKRWTATVLVSLITFMTPIASSMIAPAEPAIDRDLGVTSQFQSELIFSIFLLSFIIGPLFIAPLSEIYGRVVVLQCSSIWFLIFNFVCGFANNISEMLAFRFLAGLGACAPQTIGGGVLSDLWTSDERGQAAAIYTVAPLLGPSLGPLIGAWISERTTWRWAFWSVTIFGVLVVTLVFCTLTETFGPRILHVKAKRLRKDTGNPSLHTQYETKNIRTALRTAGVRVIIMLGTQPIVQFLSLYMALIYGITYLMLATFPNVWTDVYHESVGIGGLNYISLMIGLFLGAQLSGRLVDLLYRRLKARASNQEGCPEFRVPLLFLSAVLIAVGLIIYGWAIQKRLHWIVPNIGAAIFGLGSTVNMTALQTYTIDAYPLYAASAVGATAVARAVTGFTFPLFATYMYDSLGYGWGNTLLGLLSLGIGGSGAAVLWFAGARLRRASQYAADK